MARSVALVTGGARGIGLGISHQLALEGHDLAICGRKSADEIVSTLEELRKHGTTVSYTVCDVANRRDRIQLLNSIKAVHGRLNVLVNNAGVAPSERLDLLNASEESYDRVMSINLKGPYFLTQEVANYFVAQKADDSDFMASIVNITSVSSTLASVNRGEYCISKAGLSMATKLWAFRLAEFDIPVYEVRPGLTLTDMVSSVKEKYDKMLEDGLTLEKRWGTPKDIGIAVASLVNNKIPYATGQVLVLDGGMTLERL